MSTKDKSGGRRKARTATAPETEAPEPSALWHRLVTAVRGGVNELGEAIADTQALRILDQEIRDNDAELHRVRTALAETMARYKVAQEHLAAANAKLDEYEGYALKALKTGEDALLREIAAKIALLEIERDGHASQVCGYADGIANLRKVAAQYETNIKRLKQQVDTVRATESVQRAQVAVAQRREGSDVRVRTALDSLERIKRRQAERGAQLEAAGAMADDDALDAKLRQAGIIADDDRAEAVLARLKQKHGG
ncbi:MAG: PspA/IM30 family protein [Lysobacteraceae bacterium]